MSTDSNVAIADDVGTIFSAIRAALPDAVRRVSSANGVQPRGGVLHILHRSSGTAATFAHGTFDPKKAEEAMLLRRAAYLSRLAHVGLAGKAKGGRCAFSVDSIVCGHVTLTFVSVGDDGYNKAVAAMCAVIAGTVDCEHAVELAVAQNPMLAKTLVTPASP